MSGKNQFPIVFNWQSTNPATGFLPSSYQSGSLPSGVALGAMASTNVIYSQILEVSKMDNLGLAVSWTGTPTGTFEVWGSNDGVFFFSLTFNPVLAQPAGAAGGYGVDLNQYPWKYINLKYTNTSGVGALKVTSQLKDLN